MPIHINLLAEARAAEDMRRRDPVKRALFVGISLVAVALAWGAMEAVEVLLAKGQLTSVEVTVDTKTNAYQSILLNQKQIADDNKKIDMLNELQAGRFLQGNLLDALQHCVVDDVQLTGLRVSQSYSVTEATPAKNGAPARPARSTEKISLRLDARDFSPNPGDQVNKFKEAIAKNSYFQAMLDKTNAVQLAGQPSAPLTEDGRTFVNFTLECDFPEKVR